MVLALLAAFMGLSAAAAAAHSLSTQHSALSTSQATQAQSAEPLSPFEYAINSVIGRQLNVPGAD